MSIPAASSSSPSTAFVTTVLCANSANQGTNTPVSTIIKVKNVKVVLDIISTNVSIRNNFYAIMFIPQGFTPTVNTPQEHPEWIMVWRSVDTTTTGSTTAQNIPNVQMSSRLTRNLNSGDSIVLYQTAINPSTGGPVTISTAFYVSFVTCNN